MIESGKSNAVRWGNQLGYIILPFHLAMHDDPLEYVRKAKQIIDRKKSSLEVVIIQMAVEIIYKILGPKVHLLPFYTYTLLRYQIAKDLPQVKSLQFVIKLITTLPPCECTCL